MKRNMCLLILLLIPGFLCVFGMTALSEGEPVFSVPVQKGLCGYARNEISVLCPEPGDLTLSIMDEYNIYRILTAKVQQGENNIPWDGLGWNEERLIKKAYRFRAELSGVSGKTWETETRMELDPCLQALVFALPSCDTVWLEQQDDWFFEFKIMTDGELIAEFRPEGQEGAEAAVTCRRRFSGGRINACTFRTLMGKQKLSAGEWRIRMYAAGNENYCREFSLSVKEGSRHSPTPAATGEIMPARGASDAEIWEKMMMPATVVDIQPTAHQKIFSKPDLKSAVLGTLHGQSQALEVFEVRNEWARIGAWNHETADYVEGWIPSGVLKVVEPQREFGLLLDKKAQTLTLYRYGKPVDTVLVCTGRIRPGELYQETAAGSFLTDVHKADYSTNGLKYDYVIRYDGGNLLHQIPYAWGAEKKDLLAGSVYLGSKASHACIRIQASPSAQGINAYWLWTHLPYHTRLIILDDPEERKAAVDILQGTTPDLKVSYQDSWHVISDVREPDEHDIVLTFGGDVAIGGRESYYGSRDGMPAYLERFGTDYPFTSLKEIFENDDLTVMNLECVLKDSSSGEDKEKQWRFRGLTSYADLFPASSVELLNVANNHTIDYGEQGYASTLAALAGKTDVCGNGLTVVREIKGHLFGFAGCRETAYLKDPEVIDRDILSLREQGAEYIIYQCHWGEEYSEHFNALQEAMARRCERAGADLVIGHHPHVVQGIQWIGDMPVVYSLGNLVFGGTIKLTTYDGLLVQAVFSPEATGEERIRLRLLPVLTSSQAALRINDYHPVIAEGADQMRILQQIQRDTSFLLTDRAELPEYVPAP